MKLMIGFRLNKAMFFVLVITLLSMQWSTAHIHLTEHHDHSESHHQHNFDSHTHSSLIQHESITASFNETNDHESNLVELDNDCNIHKWNNSNDQYLALNFTTLQANTLPSVNSTISIFHSSKRRYIDYSSISPRAPPKFS